METGDDRRLKLDGFRASGVDPYPHDFPDRTEISAVRAQHESLEAGAETSDTCKIAGRLTARREMGKQAFLDLRDGTGAPLLYAVSNVFKNSTRSGTPSGGTQATSLNTTSLEGDAFKAWLTREETRHRQLMQEAGFLAK